MSRSRKKRVTYEVIEVEEGEFHTSKNKDVAGSRERKTNAYVEAEKTMKKKKNKLVIESSGESDDDYGEQEDSKRSKKKNKKDKEEVEFFFFFFFFTKVLGARG